MIRGICLQVVCLYLLLLIVAVVVRNNAWLVFIALSVGWLWGMIEVNRYLAYRIHRRCIQVLMGVLKRGL